MPARYSNFSPILFNQNSKYVLKIFYMEIFLDYFYYIFICYLFLNHDEMLFIFRFEAGYTTKYKELNKIFNHHFLFYLINLNIF